MSLQNAINVYSQLFDHRVRHDKAFYRSVYTNLVAVDALEANLRGNAEAVASGGVNSLANTRVYHDLFLYGVQFLQHATNTHHIEVPAAPSHRKNLPKTDLEGEDITSLSAKTPAKEEVLEPPKTVDSEFAAIDGDLRVELTANIARILQTWFRCVGDPNKGLLHRLFVLPGTSEILNDSHLYALLYSTRTYLELTLDDIEAVYADANPRFLGLGAVKELLFLLYEALRAIFFVLPAKSKKTTNNLLITKSLLFTFYKVEFASVLNRILQLTSNSVNEEGEVNPPPIRLSFETLMKVFVATATLSNVPTAYLLVDKVSLSLDITTMDVESPNVYENLIKNTKQFTETSYHSEICLKFLPILARNFNQFYQFKPDLFISQVTDASFFDWITGSRFSDNLYLSYDTVNTTTDMIKNHQNLFLVDKDPIVAELGNRFPNKGDEDPECIDILPLNLLLLSLSRNPSFLGLFTHQPAVNHKIEDYAPSEDTKVCLLEIWLCVMSYVFQYQHKGETNRHISKTALLLLLQLTSPNSHDKEGHGAVIDNLKRFQINEFKWKLCHHRSPIIPNNLDKDGFKLSLFYIFDIVQILLRYNLTRKLALDEYTMGVTIIYQISAYIRNLNAEDTAALKVSNYLWGELFQTLVNVLAFIDKQNVPDTEPLAEEIFAVFEVFLDDKFSTTIQLGGESSQAGAHVLRAVNHDLIYCLLRQYEHLHGLFERVVDKRGNFSNLTRCFRFIAKDILGEGQEGEPQLDLLHIDYDSPSMIEKISGYTVKRGEVEDVDSLSGDNYTYRETFKWLELERAEAGEKVVETFAALYRTKWV